MRWPIRRGGWHGTPCATAAHLAQLVLVRAWYVDGVNDEAALIEAWRAGDRSAAASLVARHYDEIVRFFRSKVSVGSDELVQATFLTCAEALPRYRGESGFRAFLFGIARMKLHEHLRGKVRDARVDPDFGVSSVADLDPGMSTIVAQATDVRHLRAALLRLPVDLQTLLELYYWEELSVGELADVFETKPGTIKSRLFKARALLRDALERPLVVGDGDAPSEGDVAALRAELGAWDAVDRRRGDLDAAAGL